MASLELLLQQHDLLKRLKLSIRNFGKDGSSRKTISYFTTRLEIVESTFASISKLHSQIITISDKDAEEYSKSNLFGDAEESFVNFKSDLRDGLAALQPAPPQTPQPLAPQGNIPNANHLEFKLPTIAVPSFNGEYSAWPSYRNSFQHLIANNINLSNVQRLHYLKGSLVGDAKRLVQHYDIIDANYAAAWDKLVSRYDNKKLLVNNLLKTIIHHPGQSKESSSQLRLLIDTFTDTLNGLRTLDVPTAGWDPIIIHLMIEKLPAETHSLWEASQMANNDLPNLTNLVTFLENRFRTLEAIAEKPSSDRKNPFATLPKPNHNNARSSHKSFSHHTSSSSITCTMCNKDHYLRACSSFLKMGTQERLKYVQQKKLCVNCLAYGHQTSACPSRMNCPKCNKRHNSLLHFEIPNASTTSAVTTSGDLSLPGPSNASYSANSFTTSVEPTIATSLTNSVGNLVLLATATLNVMHNSGYTIPLRALIDPGSQVSFITNKAIQRLQLKPESTRATVFGIGRACPGTSTKRVSLSLQSPVNSDFHMESEFLTIPQITGSLPQSSFSSSKWSHIHNIHMADPSYNLNGPIDLLLGAEMYGRIVLPGLQKGLPHEPVAQNTLIGWILLGGSSQSLTSSQSLHICVEIDSRLRSFWEYEEPTSIIKPSDPEDLLSESHFMETHSRDQSGRYMVRLPFKLESSSLGASRPNAVNRLLQIERKLS